MGVTFFTHCSEHILLTFHQGAHVLKFWETFLYYFANFLHMIFLFSLSLSSSYCQWWAQELILHLIKIFFSYFSLLCLSSLFLKWCPQLYLPSNSLLPSPSLTVLPFKNFLTFYFEIITDWQEVMKVGQGFHRSFTLLPPMAASFIIIAQ